MHVTRERLMSLDACARRFASARVRRPTTRCLPSN